MIPKNSSINQKMDFMKQHPYQPTVLHNVSWSLFKLYNTEDQRGKIVLRKWLTLQCDKNNDVKALYCSICIAFSTSSTNFSTGCTNFRNIYATVESHEISKVHICAVESYVKASNNDSIEYLINRNMMNMRKKQVEERIHVLKQVFEIIKFLGKQNLPYRGTGDTEGLYKMDDVNINRGNFLELLKFTAERDAILKQYLNNAILSSKKRKLNMDERKKNSKGRGSLVTLVSKTTVNKLIEGILETMRQHIREEMGDQQFSIQV